jgi:hypothetical protein
MTKRQRLLIPLPELSETDRRCADPSCNSRDVAITDGPNWVKVRCKKCRATTRILKRDNGVNP